MIDRSQAPSAGTKIEFHLPDITHIQLDSGLKILHVKKRNLPIVQLSFLIGAGSKRDPLDQSGLSHLTAMMIDEGAGPYNALQLDNEIEKLGSILSLSNNHDMLYVSMLTLKEHYERSLELTSLVIRQPNLNEEDYQREFNKLKNKIIQMQDEPSFIASTVFEKILLKDTYYERPNLGSLDSIKNLQLKDLKNFFTQYFSPDNTILIVVGDIDINELKESANKYFSDWKTKFPETNTITSLANSDKKIFLINKPNSAQTEIRLGHNLKKRNNESYYPQVILNSILGGQFSSRINLNLREDKGYTYGVNSSFNYYADAGLFRVATAVNIENTIDSVNEIFKEIDGVKNEIHDHEIEFTKSFLTKGFPSKFETYGQIASNLNTLVIHNLQDDYFNTYLENISAVTKEDIMKTATESLHPEKMSIVLVGDSSAIKKQVDSKYEIVELDIEGNEL